MISAPHSARKAPPNSGSGLTSATPFIRSYHAARPWCKLARVIEPGFVRIGKPEDEKIYSHRDLRCGRYFDLGHPRCDPRSTDISPRTDCYCRAIRREHVNH